MRTSLVLLCSLITTSASLGCSNSSTSSTPSGDAGEPAPGPADMHCVGSDGGLTVQSVSPASCFVNDAGADAGPAPADDAGAPLGNDYGATMYGTEGDDDDCKYHVSYSVSPIYDHYNLTWVVTVTSLTDGSPVTGIPAPGLILEADLGETHAATMTGDPSIESPPGTYTVKNFQFDASGQWTVRFHIHEECFDVLDDSPHGHAAFYIDVP